MKATYKHPCLGIEEEPTSKKTLLVQEEGQREVKRDVRHYNLDMLLSVGYRVSSALRHVLISPQYHRYAHGASVLNRLPRPPV